MVRGAVVGTLVPHTIRGSMMSQTHPIRAIGLTAALTVATGLAACAPTPFTVNPELADEEIAVAEENKNRQIIVLEYQ